MRKNGVGRSLQTLRTKEKKRPYQWLFVRQKEEEEKEEEEERSGEEEGGEEKRIPLLFTLRLSSAGACIKYLLDIRRE